MAKDGWTDWIEASYNPVVRNGNVARILKIATDITHRAKSIELLCASIRQLADGNLVATINANADQLLA